MNKLPIIEINKVILHFEVQQQGTLMKVHHFILTRFNIELWNKDKRGKTFDRKEWLRERVRLFETYTLPSILHSNEDDFEWIILVSECEEWDWFKLKLKEWKEKCRQLQPVKVKRERGWRFAGIFAEIVRQRLKERKADEEDFVLTTYFDGDDCIMLSEKEVGKITGLVQRKFSSNNAIDERPIAVFYDYGLQYFEELGIATKVRYPNNHFLTLAEKAGDLSRIKTCYGYGSHFLLEKDSKIRIEHIKNQHYPIWIEVIHKGNVDNDVKMTFDTHFVNDEDTLQRDFGLNITLQSNNRLRWIARMVREIFRRGRGKFAMLADG